MHLTADLIKGDVQIAAMPCNAAATLIIRVMARYLL